MIPLERLAELDALMRTAAPGRPLVVCQAPASDSPSGAPPLMGRCGARIARLAGLLPPAGVPREAAAAIALVVAFERVNMIESFQGRRGATDVFSPTRAAAAGVAAGFSKGRTVVLLGRAVARAFAVDLPYYVFGAFDVAPGGILVRGTSFRVAISPHPSGRSRYWNERARREEAAAFWRSVARKGNK